jgi:hypothetical protein
VIVPATAAVPAPITGQFLIGRQSTQLKRLVDVLMDGLLNLMQLLLGVQKTARHGIL